MWASDIEPERDDVEKLDALALFDSFPSIVTNPPWERETLHKLILKFKSLAPTWLLLDADWKHTKQAAPYMKYCRKVVAVGRLKWIPDSKHTGKDNCAWYLFQDAPCETIFIGRT